MKNTMSSSENTINAAQCSYLGNHQFLCLEDPFPGDRVVIPETLYQVVGMFLLTANMSGQLPGVLPRPPEWLDEAEIVEICTTHHYCLLVKVWRRKMFV